MSHEKPGELTAEQRQRADEIAGSALDLPDSDRADFVRAQCDDDSAVFAEVISLLGYVPKANEKDLLGTTPVLPPMTEEDEELPFKPLAIPGFKIQRELGHGGMGVVYEAVQPSLDRTVALKVLPASLALNPTAVERFRREARAAAKLHDPHIVPVYELGEHEGLYYYTMELVEGLSLAKQIQEKKQASPASAVADPGDIVEVVEQTAALAEALHAAHEMGLLHRDLKPSNIIVDADGRYRLIDFGLVRERGAGTLTLSGELLGTLAYMAPEQLAHQAIDRRTDLYSLGATLYEALTLSPPFEGNSDHQLQSKILMEEPERPTRKNLKLSSDLEIIVLKALEKSPNRRYETARAFAEDLQRFLHHEPIQAQPVGPVTKAFRWTRRNPAKTVAIGAALVVMLMWTGYLVGQRILRAQSAREHLAEAVSLLEKDDFAGAMEAVGRAQGLDPSSFSALSTRTLIEEKSLENETRLAALAVEEERQEALQNADRARDESAGKLQAYKTIREAIGALKIAIQSEEKTIYSQYVSEAQRAGLARMERELERREVASERLLQEAREALERADRLEAPWGGRSRETETALADFFFDRWQEALVTRDTVREEIFRASVEASDKSGRYKEALLGRGSLLLNVTPVEAEIFLFRYEPYEMIRTDPPVVSRLVPVPSTGIGRVREGAWVEDFYPGDLCLCVTEVREESVAWQAGLRPGDLVIQLNGAPCGHGLFVQSIEPDSPAADKGIRPLARIAFIDGDPLEILHDWLHVGKGQEWANKHTHRLVVEGITMEATCSSNHQTSSSILTEISGISPGSPLGLVRGRMPFSMTLLCLHDGEPVTLSVAKGEPTGLTCEVTAYPLILSTKNRLHGDTPLAMDPGSYLLYIRGPGFEGQRYPVVVPRNEAVTAHVELLEVGSTPPGFVYIPPGPFIFGGDPEAFNAASRQVIDQVGFFIAKKEVTNKEWFAFVNDEDTQNRIEKNSDDVDLRNLFLPRQSKGLLARKVNGRWEPSYGPPETPLLGISRYEVYQYLDWRNQKAREAHEPWTYTLTGEKEWEKAARGVDGRIFPWGDRFDFSLTVTKYRKKAELYSVPGGFEPRDVSPFGVKDMGGSRMEWTREETSPESRMYIARGGAWAYMNEMFSRCATRDPKVSSFYSADLGFRLIAMPLE